MGATRREGDARPHPASVGAGGGGLLMPSLSSDSDVVSCTSAGTELAEGGCIMREGWQSLPDLRDDGGDDG